jgi:hypothetical protein
LQIEREVDDQNSSVPASITKLREWAHAVQTTLHDDSVFSRQAAVHGLAHLNQVWPTLAQHSSAEPLFRSLCLSVYDLLNDDDEEIRIEAAKSAHKILSADTASLAGGPTVPLVATQQLAELLTRRWPESSELFETAISRAFGVSSQNVSVEQQLQSFDKVEYALFAEEKQNLYIDDVRETRIWAKVAMHMSASVVQEPVVTRLAEWTVDGLGALKSTFEISIDGPLGWSTHDSAFLLGLQVVHAAEVLLQLTEQGVSLPVESSVLRDDMVALLQAAKKRGGNMSWIREGERVLDSVTTGYSWETV